MSLCIFRELMDPILEQKVLHPPMVSTAVVRHYVHDHLQALIVGPGNIFLVLGIASETRIDPVVVTAGIAMVGLTVLVVHQERSAPDRGSSKVGDIVQMIDDSLKVAAMTTERTAAVSQFEGIICVVVARVGIGKTVRIDKVDEI